MLHTVEDDYPVKLYCGAHTMCAITGMTSSKIFHKLNAWFAATSPDDLVKFMYTLGWEVPPGQFTRFDQCIHADDFHKMYQEKGTFAVYIPGHVFAYSQGMVSDTLSGCEPMPFKTWKKLTRPRRIECWTGFQPVRSLRDRLAEVEGLRSWEMEVAQYQEGETWNGAQREENDTCSIPSPTQSQKR